MYSLEHKQMSVLTFKDLFTTFKGSTNVSYNKNLPTFVCIGDNTNTTVYLKSNYFNAFCHEAHITNTDNIVL